MTNITIAVPKDLHEKMKSLSEVRWSEVARRAFEDKIRSFEIAEVIAKKSKLSQGDVDEISAIIKKETWKDLKKECA